MGLRIKFKFNESHRDTFVEPENRFLKSIFWNWTNACNNRCNYCYMSSGTPLENELNTNEAKEAIDNIARADVKTIVLAGGEPLIRKDCKELIDHIYDNGLEMKICTNGYFLDKDMMDFLARRNVVGLQIALEGTEKGIYDSIKRPMRDDSFERVVHAIDMAVNDYSIHNIVSMVPVKQNKDNVEPMIEYCREKGVDTLSLYKLIPFGQAIQNSDIIIPENEFLDLLPKWIDNFVDNEPHWIIETEPPYAKASGILRKYEDKIDVHYSGCKAGITLMSVMPNGNIVPCHVADLNELYLGNILKDDLNEIWKNHPILDYFNGKRKPEECVPCTSWESCLGGCRIASLGITGSLETKDPLCKYWINNGCLDFNRDLPYQER